MQKSPLQYGEIIFQSKVIPLFLPNLKLLLQKTENLFSGHPT